MHKEIVALNKKSKSYAPLLASLKEELEKVIVGQPATVNKLILALLCQGHVLIEGVPGLAKTLMIKTLARCLDGNFARIQFTPDLLPADILGTKIYNHKSSTFSTVKGPIFTNFILADEINRAPPKVQSALLEAMQEQQVSIQGETFKLKQPFLVLATQNPIESEGTYKLPEAQVDRFMSKIIIDYPQKQDEVEIIKRYTQGHTHNVQQIISAKQLLQIQQFIPQVYADESIVDYVANIIDATRRPKQYNLKGEDHIEYGASVRASLWLVLGAKAHAVLQGRGYVTPEDVCSVAPDVLRHRVLLTYEAEAEEITSDHLISQILHSVPVP